MATALKRSRGLPSEVAAYIRELIISGEVRPGEFLRLEPIAEALDVSNTPVREGLLALCGEGFVKLVPRRGFMVERFTAEDVHDIFWAQAKLAGELAARAAKRITPEEIAQLETILDDYGIAVEAGDDEQIINLGQAFHRQINRSAQSNRLALILNSIVHHLPTRFYATIEGHVEATRIDHRRILEAMRTHNVDEACRLTEEHLLSSIGQLIESLKSRGLWDDNPPSNAGVTPTSP